MSQWQVLPGADPVAAKRFADLDAVFALEGEIIAKDSTTRTVRVEFNGRRYYVKRYHGLGKKPLRRWFGTPRAWILPSLVHDALYQALREGKLGRQHRDAIDGLFYRQLRGRGVSWLVATVAYWCVRVGGNFAVRKTNPVREAV